MSLPEGYGDLITQGQKVIWEKSPAVADQQYRHWEEGVAAWLNRWFPESGSSAEWISLPGSKLAGFLGGEFIPTSAIDEFHNAIRKRLEWLGKLPSRVGGEGFDAPLRRDQTGSSKPQLGPHSVTNMGIDLNELELNVLRYLKDFYLEHGKPQHLSATRARPSEIMRRFQLDKIQYKEIIARFESFGWIEEKLNTGAGDWIKIDPIVVDVLRQLVIAPRKVRSMPDIDIFVSHSGKDVSIATALIELLKASLNLSSRAIRCTSVPGYKLEAGADTDEQLRHEIFESKTFIGLITDVSIESTYVLFELGARWGADRHLAPLLAAGATPEILRGPLAGKNALSCDNVADIHQLIENIGRKLERVTEPVASYQGHVDDLIKASEKIRRKRAENPL